jgi:hypothetical protein
MMAREGVEPPSLLFTGDDLPSLGTTSRQQITDEMPTSRDKYFILFEQTEISRTVPQLPAGALGLNNSGIVS